MTVPAPPVTLTIEGQPVLEAIDFLSFLTRKYCRNQLVFVRHVNHSWNL